MARGHKVTVREDQDQLFYARCNCGWSSGTERFRHKWQAEDLVIEHQENIERIKRFLSGRPSLKSELAHAQRMIDDPNTSERDRETWQVLADGYAARLREDTDVPDGLW